MTEKFKSQTQHASDGVEIAYWNRHWFTQRRPYKSPLEFRYQSGRQNSFSGYDSPGGPGNLGGYYGDATDAYNRAYNSLKDQFSNPSTWANNLLEAEQSLGALTGRLSQLGRFAGALRRGDFGAASKALGLNRKNVPPGVRKGKPFADNFLEYHFGWAPMAQDIGSACKTVADADFGAKKIFARATSSVQKNFTSSSSGYHFSSYDSQTFNSRYHVQLGARVQISNPNAFLANQLGFANPLAVAWEAVPYSFVVDWFVNVGDCLSAMTDFVGLSVSGAYNTLLSIGDMNHVINIEWLDHPEWDLHRSSSGTQVTCTRDFGIPGPTLAVRPFKGLSVTRAATACALLLQKL